MWLTPNATRRALGDKRAKELNEVYKTIVEEKHVYENFDYVYYDFP